MDRCSSLRLCGCVVAALGVATLQGCGSKQSAADPVTVAPGKPLPAALAAAAPAEEQNKAAATRRHPRRADEPLPPRAEPPITPDLNAIPSPAPRGLLLGPPVNPSPIRATTPAEPAISQPSVPAPITVTATPVVVTPSAGLADRVPSAPVTAGPTPAAPPRITPDPLAITPAPTAAPVEPPPIRFPTDRPRPVAGMASGNPAPARPLPEPVDGGPADASVERNPLRSLTAMAENFPAARPSSAATATAAPPQNPPAIAFPLAAAGSSSSPSAAGSVAPAAGGTEPPVAHPRVSHGKHSGVPFDPIKENGPIFEGWTTPRLAVLVSGRIDGYIEPCGCAGLERMKGGMARRYSLVNQLRQQQGWPLVCVDLGGFIKGYGAQADQKFQTLVEAYRKTGYDGLGIGVNELRMEAGNLASAAGAGRDPKNPMLSANVAPFGADAKMMQPYRVVTVNGVRVGITALLSPTLLQAAGIKNDAVEIGDPAARLLDVLAKMRQEQADYVVLLAYAPKAEAAAWGRKANDDRLRLVVVADGPAVPPPEYAKIDGTKAIAIEVGDKGMYAVVIGLYETPGQPPVRYQRVPLDSRFVSAPPMIELMDAYQSQLKAMGFDGLGLRPIPHPQKDVQGNFVGSDKCKDCHEESFKVWRHSEHAKAYATLEQARPPRNYDPECVSCHVIGWNANGFFPYQGGYWSKPTTPHLTDVGCESCHGPGEKHCAAEQGGNIELQKKLQQAMVITKADAEKHLCRTCHDLDNSPEFDFNAYWPLVEHREDKDKESEKGK